MKIAPECAYNNYIAICRKLLLSGPLLKLVPTLSAPLREEASLTFCPLVKLDPYFPIHTYASVSYIQLYAFILIWNCFALIKDNIVQY